MTRPKMFRVLLAPMVFKEDEEASCDDCALNKINCAGYECRNPDGVYVLADQKLFDACVQYAEFDVLPE